MSSLNKIILIGELIDTPDSQSSNQQAPLTKLQLSVSRPKRSETQVEQKDVFTIIGWRHIADLMTTFKKGDLCLFEGRIQTRTYDDQEGQRHWVTEIEAREAKRLEKNSSSVDKTDSLQNATTLSAEASSEPFLPNDDVLEQKEAPQVTESSFDFTSDQDLKKNKQETPEIKGASSDLFEKEINEDIPF